MAAKKKQAADAAEENPDAPRLNPDCIGHESAERAIKEAFDAGRMHHALLISGPPGVGKATFAYRVARFVLSGGKSPEMDGLAIAPDTGVFRRVASGGHADLRILERQAGKTQIAVDDVRDVVSFSRLTPAESDWRVVIVDKADHLNRSSANALLKILEEPPARSLFMILADAPGGVLPTIRSRCQILPLRPLRPDQVAEILRRRRPELDDREAAAISVLAEGAAGQAMAYADAGALDLYAMLVDVIGEPNPENVGPVIALADKVGGRGAEDAYKVFRTLVDWWFKRWIGAIARGREPDAAMAGEAAAFAACRQRGAGLETWIRLWENLNAQLAGTDPPRNLDKRQAVVGAFLALRAANS